MHDLSKYIPFLSYLLVLLAVFPSPPPPPRQLVAPPLSCTPDSCCMDHSGYFIVAEAGFSLPFLPCANTLSLPHPLPAGLLQIRSSDGSHLSSWFSLSLCQHKLSNTDIFKKCVGGKLSESWTVWGEKIVFPALPFNSWMNFIYKSELKIDFSQNSEDVTPIVLQLVPGLVTTRFPYLCEFHHPAPQACRSVLESPPFP